MVLVLTVETLVYVYRFAEVSIGHIAADLDGSGDIFFGIRDGWNFAIEEMPIVYMHVIIIFNVIH